MGTEIVSVKAECIGGDRGLTPGNLEGMLRLSQAMFASGLLPKGLPSVEAVFTAMQFGMELGLRPGVAARSVAVINGRATLWGDGLLGVARAHPAWNESTFREILVDPAGVEVMTLPTNPADGFAAVCELGRTGGQVQRQAFSVGDAKRAGLWGKSGPWQTYPARMLKMRARGFAIRDVFADALGGFVTEAEAEANDTPTTPVNAPRPSARYGGDLPAITATPAPVEAVVVETKADPTPEPDVAPPQPRKAPEPVAAPVPPRDPMLSAFESVGVTAEQVRAYSDDVAKLREVYAAMKTGGKSWVEATGQKTEPEPVEPPAPTVDVKAIRAAMMDARLGKNGMAKIGELMLVAILAELGLDTTATTYRADVEKLTPEQAEAFMARLKAKS
jgi:hypothetical protein